MSDYNDQPISMPDDDEFEFNHFAKAIASCIDKIDEPIGSVIAIYGPWGSGKTSVVNLVKHHIENSEILREPEDSGDSGEPEEHPEGLKIIDFQSWMYQSESALAVGFLRALNSEIYPKRSKAKKYFLELSTRILGDEILTGTTATTITGNPIFGSGVAWISRTIKKVFSSKNSVEALHDKIFGELDKLNKRFLIIIDDLDRLSPDQSILIFRLIKSVGRLPNIIYLLAYDRSIVEKSVEEKYPSEGSHYLEKVIQAGFDIPNPSPADLKRMLNIGIKKALNGFGGVDSTRFDEVLREIVIPVINTPRDIHRLSNPLSITYSAVADEVCKADFLGIEVLRIFYPLIYHRVRKQKSSLVGPFQTTLNETGDSIAKAYEDTFLHKPPAPSADQLALIKQALMILFPRLAAAWSTNDDRDISKWSRQRRVCSGQHFDTYFRYTRSHEAIPKSEIEGLIGNAQNKKYVQSMLRNGLNNKTASGRSITSYLLEELNYHAESISVAAAGELLKHIYSIADVLDIESDHEFDFMRNDNNKRIYYLTNALLLGRTTLPERSKIMMDVCEDVPLEWFVHISNAAYRDYFPRGNDNLTPDNDCLLTKDDAVILREKSLDRIREAATNGELEKSKSLAFLLSCWKHMVEDPPKEVRKFCDTMLDSDDGVAKLANAYLDKMFSSTLGEKTVTITDIAQVSGTDAYLDIEKFRTRLDEVIQNQSLDDDSINIVKRFQTALNNHQNYG